MLKKAAIVIAVAVPVAVIAVEALRRQYPMGPVVLALGLIPVAGLLLAGRHFAGALPDMIFGALDTGLLVIPAIGGGLLFGVAGAVAGGVVGDALTDGIAGFFEGGIAERLRAIGITESREAVTTSLGKMSGCLIGAGLVMTLTMLAGIELRFS